MDATKEVEDVYLIGCLDGWNRMISKYKYQLNQFDARNFNFEKIIQESKEMLRSYGDFEASQRDDILIQTNNENENENERENGMERQEIINEEENNNDDGFNFSDEEVYEGRKEIVNHKDGEKIPSNTTSNTLLYFDKKDRVLFQSKIYKKLLNLDAFQKNAKNQTKKKVKPTNALFLKRNLSNISVDSPVNCFYYSNQNDNDWINFNQEKNKEKKETEKNEDLPKSRKKKIEATPTTQIDTKRKSKRLRK